MEKEIPKRFLNKDYFYFDTSSMNHLIKKPDHDFKKTQNLWVKKGRMLCMSPVNLYEIFQNTDSRKKEEILYKMGVLYYGQSTYFDTPTRILFGEILGYTTKKLTSAEDKLKDAWFDLKHDPEHITINLDFNDFIQRRLVFKIFKKAIRFILTKDILKISKKELYFLSKKEPYLLGVYILKLISTRFESTSFDTEKQLKAFLIYLIFCFGVEPENSFLEEYWKGKEEFEKSNEIIRTLNRMMALLEKNKEEWLFNNMFIQLMTDYILFEHKKMKKKIKESTLSDALHLIYSFFCLNFITDDSSILAFSKNNKFLKDRVYSVKKDFFLTEKQDQS